MKINPLNYGVNIENINLSSCPVSQLRNIIEVCVKERLVVLKGQKISIERFDEINDVFGIHQPAYIWANHRKFPKIFRVTNKEVSKGKKGLFHGQKLDWHCDGAFCLDYEECICLWCIEPSMTGGETWFACGVHAYNNLNDSIREELKEAKIFLTNEVSKTYTKESLYGTLLPHEHADFDKAHSRNRFFAGGAKGNPYDKNISYIKTSRKDLPYGKKRRRDIIKPLVINHPCSNEKGLYFPFNAVAEIINVTNPICSKKIFKILVKNYVGAAGKIYKHKWEHGDLIISDQVHSLHRREPYSGTRELYRTAFWYHNSKPPKENLC